MLKIQHTEWPVGRKPMTNEIKEGGLWYRDQQEQLLNQAKRLARKKPKDQWVTFGYWFWPIFTIGSIITFYYINSH